VLSISIVTYQLEVELFHKLLESLYVSINSLASESDPVTIKIIDNGNQEQLLSDICSGFKNDKVRLEIISGLKNIGYGRAHNLGILTSNTEFHLILNPDVLLDPESLSEGISYLRNTENVCAVTPLCRDEKGDIQYLAKRYPSVLDLILRGLAPRKIQSLFGSRLSRYESREIINQDSAGKVELISGCFMLCRTDFLKKIGGFDERYFLYFEDFALSMEMQKHGALHFLPSMKIIHYGGDTAKKGLRHIVMFISSSIKFFNQYGWKLL
jgi:hypothetical protein